MPYLIGPNSPPHLQHMVVDRSATQAAQEISMTKWETWLPQAKPPFEDVVIEWKCADMLAAMASTKSVKQEFVRLDSDHNLTNVVFSHPDYDEAADVNAMVVTQGKVWFHVGTYVGDKPANMMLPWVVELGLPRDDRDPDQVFFERIAFGIGYNNIFGGYPNVKIRRDALYRVLEKETPTIFAEAMERGRAISFDRIDGHVKTTEYGGFSSKDTYLMPDASLAEFAGVVRFGLSMLALLNSERETVDAVGYKKATFRGGKVVKLPKTRLVVIRPDAARKVYEKRDVPTGIKKCDHPVRRHLRRYANGKLVWVREHRRGDPLLGTVEHKYILEMDPNKDLPQ